MIHIWVVWNCGTQAAGPELSTDCTEWPTPTIKCTEQAKNMLFAGGMQFSAHLINQMKRLYNQEIKFILHTTQITSSFCITGCSKHFMFFARATHLLNWTQPQTSWHPGFCFGHGNIAQESIRDFLSSLAPSILKRAELKSWSCVPSTNLGKHLKRVWVVSWEWLRERVCCSLLISLRSIKLVHYHIVCSLLWWFLIWPCLACYKMVLTNETDIFSGHVLDATDQRALEELKLNEILVSGQKGSWRRGSSQKCSSFFFSPEICQKSINRTQKNLSEEISNKIYLASWCLATTSWKCSSRLGKSISSMNFFFLCLCISYMYHV